MDQTQGQSMDQSSMDRAAGYQTDGSLTHNPFNDEFDESGLVTVAQAIESAEVVPPPPEHPPLPSGQEIMGELEIVPLGHAGGSYFFLSKSGEKIEFKARDLVRLNIASLFGGNTIWLCANFPCYNKRDERIDGAFNANQSAEWLMMACSKKGLFNSQTPVHGLGVWRSGKELVAHFGKMVWIKGEKEKSGRIYKGAIYPALAPTEEPDFDNPADALDCKQLRQYMNAWTFVQPYDADLLFGFMGAGMLGGFPSWRVHAFIEGERGTGKSTLGEYLINIIGAQGITKNDYTKAGIEQTLTDEGRMAFLDEGENDGEDHARRMANVIGLMRLMSSGKGAQLSRGSSGGKARNSTVTGCILMAAINPPKLQPQDRSRILLVPIAKPEHRRAQEDIDHFLSEAARLSPAVRARALLGADRFIETVALYRDQFIKHGCDARQADLFSTLCAGRSLLIHDAVPTEEGALSLVTKLQDRLSLIMLDDSEESDAMSCLNKILGTPCAAIRDGIKRTNGMVIADAFSPNAHPENEKLIPTGLKLLRGRDGGLALFIANRHPGLEALFHNSKWSGGGWRNSLVRLQGVSPHPTPLSLGLKTRGLVVPASLLPQSDEATDVYDLPPDPAPPHV